MAKFGWDERKLFYVDNLSVTDTTGDPGAPSAAEGSLRIFSSDDGGTQRLYIRDSVASILMPIDAVDAAAVTGQSLVKGKNADGELEFYAIKSADGHLDIALVGDDIELTVDLSDINDELDHGLLLGLADDDHAQYLLLAGRSGGQIANGGTDASDDLELRSTANATKGSVKVVDGSDFEFNKKVFKEAAVQTTDIIEDITMFAITLDPSKSYYVKVDVVAQSDDETERAMFEQTQGAYRLAAGGAVLQGNQMSQHKTRTNGQMIVTYKVNGDDLEIEVGQGTMTDDIDWRGSVEILRLS